MKVLVLAIDSAFLLIYSHRYIGIGRIIVRQHPGYSAKKKEVNLFRVAKYYAACS
jgi:hypothetical protein